MTPSERERVTEVVRAAEKELLRIVRELGGIRVVEKRAERAEAAARDFEKAARGLIEAEQRWSQGAPGYVAPSPTAAFVSLLARHPSYLDESETRA